MASPRSSTHARGNGDGQGYGVLRPFVWLLPILLFALLVSPWGEEETTESAAQRVRGRSLPPPHAALMAFRREHHMVPVKPPPLPLADAPALAPAPLMKTTLAPTTAAPVLLANTNHNTASTTKTSKTDKGPRAVDVVYCINLPEDTSFFRIDYGEIESLLRQTVRHLGSGNGNGSDSDTTLVRFHLLSNDDEAIARMRALHPGLRVHDYRLVPPSNRSEAFLQRYVHQSVNPLEMERLCMWRWILTADYFTALQQEDEEEGGPPRLILGIDTDVGLFQPSDRLLSEWKLQHWVDKGFESHQIALGAAMLWSPQGLESFAAFIGSVYASPEEASRRVQEWGDTFPFCRPARSLLLPCDPNATKPEMWHMSDMDLLRAWLLQNTTVRTRKEEERCLVVRQARKASGVRFFLRRDDEHHKATDGTAAPVPTLMGIRPPGSNATNSTSTSTSTSNQAALAEEAGAQGQEVCLVHFQGPGSKKLILPFEAFLEENTTTTTTTKPEGKGDQEGTFVLP